MTRPANLGLWYISGSYMENGLEQSDLPQLSVLRRTLESNLISARGFSETTLAEAAGRYI